MIHINNTSIYIQNIQHAYIKYICIQLTTYLSLFDIILVVKKYKKQKRNIFKNKPKYQNKLLTNLETKQNKM